MNIQFHTQHIQISDDQKRYITSALEPLFSIDKHIDDPSSLLHIDVKHLPVKNKDESIEIDIKMIVPHGDFYVSDSGKTPEEAVDRSVKKLRNQLEKYKDKHNHLHNAAKDVDGNKGEFDDLIEEIE